MAQQDDFMNNISGAVNLAQTGYGAYQSMTELDDINTKDYFSQPIYNEDYQPQSFQEVPMPEEISKGVGTSAGIEYATKFGAEALKTGNPYLVGGAVLAGAGLGAYKGMQARNKRQQFNAQQDQAKVSYAQAMNAYGANQIKKQQSLAKQKSQSKRRENTIPLFNSSLYGL